MKNKLKAHERESLVRAAYEVKHNTLSISSTNLLIKLISQTLFGSDIDETCRFMGISQADYLHILNNYQ